MTERLALVGFYERDFVNDRTGSYGVGFIYESQCWKVETLFGLDEQDLSFGVRLTGSGISGFERPAA